ncbi:hypothetical protein [Streptomyces sp. GS7]|uniref:hypothetical protein n=1 Tax=Streptomyces sp. GS7 TaxID=2692234 RepID=UPI0019161F14|nr:hypothetical protein [Streptomyces sp. GS7]
MAERGVLTAPADVWDAAVRQAEVIVPLAEKAPPSAPPTPAPWPKQSAAASAAL